jgi:hydroxymethylpyrimidine/phosphomethylpyrimidine kinase
MPRPGKVLIIAGSDSGGGAGIQADLKTVTMLGAYGATAITAITAQNTLGVQAVEGVGDNIVSAQIHSVLSDIGADVIKIGMLHSVSTIETVMTAIEDAKFHGPIILDPVMIATSGDALLEADAIEALKRLIEQVHVITPNIPEAKKLLGRSIESTEDMTSAAKELLALGSEYVVLKGGHLSDQKMMDVLVSSAIEETIRSERIETTNTHGTGCTFASALAALIANGSDIETAFMKAHAFVREAIEQAPSFGKGHGPLGHMTVGKTD